MRILIVCIACYGFGDVVFAHKLRLILRKWRPRLRVVIASQSAAGFRTLGLATDIIPLVPRRTSTAAYRDRNDPEQDACKTLAQLKADPDSVHALEDFDVYFVAPWSSESNMDWEGIRVLTKGSATRANTLFFSEYNGHLKPSMINTGVGPGRLGMLFVDVPFSQTRRPLKDPYTIMYIAKPDFKEDVEDTCTCAQAFLDMVTAKHKQERNLVVLAPPWLPDTLSDLRLGPHVHEVVVVHASGKRSRWRNSASSTTSLTLTLRCDKLPVPWKDMVWWFAHAQPDILLTGDQSVTDFLYARACMHAPAVLWYQTMPWKENLARSMATHLRSAVLGRPSLTCGTMKGLALGKDPVSLVAAYDFETLAKPAVLGFLDACAADARSTRS